MYNHPKFNVILLSPGRTGGRLISTFFTKITNLTPYLRTYSQNVKLLEPKQLLHSHDPIDVKLGNEHTLYILSTRNLIDATFSYIIGHQYQSWHYYNHTTHNIVPFTIDTENFYNHYMRSVRFYEGFQKNRPRSYLQIDYSEFCDDERKLFSILKLNEFAYKFRPKHEIPIKTPGTYRDWIINFDEIYEYALTLQTDKLF
jgi:hypothetical protein